MAATRSPRRSSVTTTCRRWKPGTRPMGRVPTAVGDTVDLAHCPREAEAACHAGCTISEAPVLRCDLANWTVEELLPLVVKGRATPVAAFVVRRYRPMPSSACVELTVRSLLRVVAAVARNRALTGVMVAYSVFTATQNAVWIAMLVYAYDRGGARTVGAVAMAQLVLAALLAPVIPRLVVNLELGLVQPVARRGVV
jgi:hypothetical protein